MGPDPKNSMTKPRSIEPLFFAAWLAPFLVIALVAVPVSAGLIGTLLPAFGYLPALGGTDFNLAAFAQFFSEPGIARSIFLSLWIGFAATLIATLSAAAILSAGFGTRGWAVLMRFLTPISSLPHAAAAFGLAFIIMPSGFVSRLISPELTGWVNPPDVLIPNDPYALSLIFGLVMKEVPFLLLMLIGAMGQVDPARTLNMSNALGYGRLAAFAYVLWPQLYAQIRIPVFAVLAFSASIVDVSLILGPTLPPPLSVTLVRWMNDPDLSYRFVASAGALVQLGLVLILFACWFLLERLGAALRNSYAISGRRYANDPFMVSCIRAYAWGSVILLLTGIALLGLWSVSQLWQFPNAFPQGLTFNAWARALPSILGPLQTTLLIGFPATLIATLLCVLCLANTQKTQTAQRLMYFVLSLPLIVPQTAFLFGLQVAAIKSGIGYGYTALIFVHLLFVLPYVFLCLIHAWESLDPRYEQMAFGLGASRNATLLKVRLPLMLRPILMAFAVGFAVSVGLYLPTLLIGAGRLPTITTEAVALASGANRRTIGVYAFLQSIIPFIGFALAFVLPAWLFKNRAAMRVA
jgi:putative thiamine transport system permease protein